MSLNPTCGLFTPFVKHAKPITARASIRICRGRLGGLSFVWGIVICSSLASWELGAKEVSSPASIVKRTRGEEPPLQAILIKLPDDTRGDVSHDHLVFVDTSASQVGAHRLHALAVLESLLRSLPQTDRVRLFAIDVGVESLMESFSTTESHDVRSALVALKARIPLGATNLQSLFKSAMESRQEGSPSSIIYIGDGMSTADLLEVQELRAIVSTLRRQKCPVHSYGVGPVINLHVLGILAHQTGGYVDFDDHSSVAHDGGGSLKIAAERGVNLAHAVQRPVCFPARVRIVGESLPLLPLRSDRETIHLVRGDLAPDTLLTYQTTNANESLEWRLSSSVTTAPTSFLDGIAKLSENDLGLSNSLAGHRLMQLFEERFGDSIENALQIGERQLANGHTEEAAQIAGAVSQVDPTNAIAASLALSASKLRVLPVSKSTVAEEAELEAHTKPNANPSLIQEQEQSTRVKTEKLRNQVSNAIEESRHGEPEYGVARLKQVDNTIRAATDIAPEDRQQLLKRLETEITQLRNSADKRAQERVQLAEQLAQLESQKLLTEQQELDENKLEGLIERVRGLMLEGRHGNDDAYGEAQVVADVAINLRPGEKTAAAARFDAEAAHQLTRSYRLRARRADQVLETLHQVELSHIPFPDEPPVRYPSAEVWRALTDRRQKWKNVDLRSTNPREIRIQEELKQISEANFPGTPLKDAIEILRTNHGIEIQFDKAALDDEGISTEDEVALQLSGVTLRSLLRLLLEPKKLTYVIEDEVMKITTSVAADKKLTTRVYPVGDLVIPIQSMGGGMRGGMGGGMGGGMMGGGMGGGMMGGGMGGGMFSIPPEYSERNSIDGDVVESPNSDSPRVRMLKNGVGGQ